MAVLSRDRIRRTLKGYDDERVALGVIGSHSALDVCDGAAEEGLRTVAVCEKGREAPYARFYRAERDRSGRLLRGCVDEAWVLPRFADVLTAKVQDRLRRRNVLFVPNRSFTSYCDIVDVESKFVVPLVGSRNLLRTEERSERQSYYWILEQAGLPSPEPIEDPRDIDGLVIVKLPHKVKRLERGFFTAASYKEYLATSEELIRQGVISPEDLGGARIERYVIGPVFNLDFYYSPLARRGEGVELLGIDWRFESSLDGHVRLPAAQQLALPEAQKHPEYVVTGHNAATLRESLLDDAFELGEKYVKATQRLFPPGMIGPFTLQTCVDKDLNFTIFDVAPRIGGGTNVHMAVGHPYGNALWRRPMSTGRRLAVEVKRAAAEGKLDRLVT